MTNASKIIKVLLGCAIYNWLAGVSAADQAKLPKDHFFAGLSTGLQDFGTFIGDRKQQLEQVLTKML